MLTEYAEMRNGLECDTPELADFEPLMRDAWSDTLRLIELDIAEATGAQIAHELLSDTRGEEAA